MNYLNKSALSNSHFAFELLKESFPKSVMPGKIISICNCNGRLYHVAYFMIDEYVSICIRKIFIFT